MKATGKPFLQVLLMTAFFCCLGGELTGQEKINLSLGIGFTEQINLGLKFRMTDQTGLGFNLGWFPENQTNGWLLSVQGNFYYHLFGKSSYSDLRPWYARFGLNYLRDDFWGIEGVNWWYTHMRLGRDIYFSRAMGISLDAGMYYHLNPDKTGNLTFGPSMGACFFYRF